MTVEFSESKERLIDEIGEVIKEDSPLKTSELRDKLWKNGRNEKHASKSSLQRILSTIARKIKDSGDYDLKVERAESEGSRMTWKWSLK